MTGQTYTDDTATELEEMTSSDDVCTGSDRSRGPRMSARQLRRLRGMGFVCAAMVCLATPHALADDLRYEAHWVEGAAASLHTAPLSLQAFLDSGEDLAQAGFVLIDVETAMRNGQRLYAGLWTKGSGATIFEGPMGPIPFGQRMRARRVEGLRLVDFEIFRTEGGGRRYIGVWRPGSGEEILTGPMEQAAFIARGQRHVEDGLRLRDVEVEVINGTLFYSGLFRSGAGLNSITPPMTMEQFLLEQEAKLAGGQELRDIERVGGGTVDRFVGVWSSGSHPVEITSGRSFGQQFSLAQSQFNAGRRTRDFELQRIPTAPGSGGGVVGGIPDTPPEMPTNPRHVRFTSGDTLRLEFTHDGDQPFTLELPRDALPKWLPHSEAGDPILPDAHCGLRIRRADSIFWQDLGEVVTASPFLATPSVEEVDRVAFFGGVSFAGAIGACTDDTQKQWDFPFPFTTSGQIESFPNLSLLIQLQLGHGQQDHNIDFIKDTGPQAQLPSLDKLFKDDSKKKLEDALKFWDELFKGGKDIGNYCTHVGAYWNRVCPEFPESSDLCLNEFRTLPRC